MSSTCLKDTPQDAGAIVQDAQIVELTQRLAQVIWVFPRGFYVKSVLAKCECQKPTFWQFLAILKVWIFPNR